MNIMRIKYCRLAPLNPLIGDFLYLLAIQYSPFVVGSFIIGY